MLLTVINIVLGLVAVYSGGAWLYMAVLNAMGRFGRVDDTQRDRIERYTFHLGLCCIVASGFLGLIKVMGG